MCAMRDENGLDDKVLCVASTARRMSHFSDVDDVREFDRLEIQHFFEVYKALEPGKEVVIGGWVGRAEAEAEIIACRQRAVRAAIRDIEKPAGPPRSQVTPCATLGRGHARGGTG